MYISANSCIGLQTDGQTDTHADRSINLIISSNSLRFTGGDEYLNTTSNIDVYTLDSVHKC